jgi:hypothetical protein
LLLALVAQECSIVILGITEMTQLLLGLPQLVVVMVATLGLELVEVQVVQVEVPLLEEEEMEEQEILHPHLRHKVIMVEIVVQIPPFIQEVRAEAELEALEALEIVEPMQLVALEAVLEPIIILVYL